MSEPQEREELEALMTTPGWLRLLAYARATWGGDGYAQRIKLAIRTAQDRQQNVAEAVQRVDAANDEVNAILTWPKLRVQQLLQKEAHGQPLATMSRRGGL